MSTFNPLEQLRRYQHSSQILTNLVVCLLLVTFSVGIVQFGQRVFPTWNGVYLVVLTAIVALEAIATMRTTAELDFHERIIFHLSEWIAFAVLIKGMIYLSTGFQSFLSDLSAWQANFLSFFSLDYLFALTLAFAMWFSSRSYSTDITALFDREQDAGWDELGKLQNALNDIRGRMMGRVYLQGALLVFFAVLSRIEATQMSRLFGINTPGYRAPVINVLLYFMLALVLFSQTQFALLRTRWTWLHLRTSPDIARNWIVYSLLFFVSLSVIVFFLPTEYSLGLLATLQGLLALILQAGAFLLVIITFPFTWCLSLFSLSTSSGETGSVNAYPAPAPIMMAETPSSPASWLVFIRALLFWLVFLSVIIMAVSYYLRQNTTLLQSLRAFPLLRWLSRVWQAFKRWLKGVNRQVSALVKTGVQRIRLRRPAISTPDLLRLLDPRHMTPRDRVILYFVSLTRLSGERGLNRQPNQTPYQYENKLNQALPEVDSDLHHLTEAFYEARYSQHPLEELQAQQAASFWDRIRAIVQKWREDRANRQS